MTTGTCERLAAAGELCTCGRPATVVFQTVAFGDVGWCGAELSGQPAGPCPFCGGPRHDGRCPAYRLRLAAG